MATQAELEAIQKQLDAIKASTAQASTGVGILTQAKAQGLPITGKTEIKESPSVGSSGGYTVTTPGINTVAVDFNIPTDKDAQVDLGTPPAQNVLDATAGYDAYQKAIIQQINQLNQQAADYQKQLTEAQKTQSKWYEDVKGWFESKPSTTELVSQQLEQFKIPELLSQQAENISQITAYKTQLADLEKEKQQRLLAMETRPGVSLDFQTTEMNRIEREYMIRENNVSMKISALASVNEMIRGNIEQSTNFAKMYIDAATYEDSLELKKFDMFMDLNKDIISQLSDAYQNTLNAARQSLQFALSQSQDQAQFEIQQKLDEAKFQWQKEQAILEPTTGMASTDLVNAIIANPSLYNTLSATARNAVLPQLQAMGFDVTKLLPSTTFAKASAEAVASFNSAESMLDTLLTKALDAIKATSEMDAWKERATLKLQAISPNTAAGRYNNIKKAFLSMLTRAAGEKGVLTDKDVERINNALPSFGMTRDTVQVQIQTLKDLFNSIKAGATEAYGGGTTITPDNLSDEEAWNQYQQLTK